MGFFDSFSDLLEAALPWSSAEAEAQKEDEEEDVKVCFFSLGTAASCKNGYRAIHESSEGIDGRMDERMKDGRQSCPLSPGLPCTVNIRTLRRIRLRRRGMREDLDL